MPEQDRRLTPRRLAKPGVQVICREGSLGLGPNVALSVYDVSETGIRLVVKSALATGQEIEMELIGPGHSRALKILAEVVWSLPIEGGNYWAGAKLRRRLTYAEFADLT
jgi:hypothetical protein